MKFLVSRPDHDNTVFYLHEWSKELIQKAEEKGFKILDCNGEKSNRETVEKMIEKQEPELILFNGHGSPTKICGHKNEVVIEQGKNEHLLKDKIIYARSCSTAASLGASSVAKGAKAYIGYKEDFAFLTGEFSASKPLNDEYARPFLNASNQVIRSLLKGLTAQEANQRSQTVFDEEIEALERSDAPPYAEHILPLLVWDRMNQILIGNPGAKL